MQSPCHETLAGSDLSRASGAVARAVHSGAGALVARTGAMEAVIGETR